MKRAVEGIGWLRRLGLAAFPLISACSAGAPASPDAAVAEIRDAAVAEISDAAVAEVRDAAVAEVRDAAVAEIRDTAVAEIRDAAVAEIRDAVVVEIRDAVVVEIRDAPVAEKRCGEGPSVYFSAHTPEQLARFADCTILVGRFQEDSVTMLPDLAALANVRRIEGFINLFRSPGFLTLHGLENLEVVEGDVFIHLNPNLTSLAALGKLHTVTGNLLIAGNDRLSQAEVEALGARITVGGTKTLSSKVAP